MQARVHVDRDVRIHWTGCPNSCGQVQAADFRDKIGHGGAGGWGTMPMPPMPAVEEDALQQIVAWLTSGEE